MESSCETNPHLTVYLTIGFSSALDDISGETVAIKMVTRVFDKVQLAKRALREVTLLRHFANHENITGLIDVDAVMSPIAPRAPRPVQRRAGNR